jgi:hypothetical protein
MVPAVKRATPTKAVTAKAGSKSKRGKQEMAGKEEAKSAKAEAAFANKKKAILQGTDALKKVVLTSHTCGACVTPYCSTQQALKRGNFLNKAYRAEQLPVSTVQQVIRMLGRACEQQVTQHTSDHMAVQALYHSGQSVGSGSLLRDGYHLLGGLDTGLPIHWN